jgi:hypothetical protein
MEVEIDGPSDADDTAGGQPADAAGRGGAAAASAAAPAEAEAPPAVSSEAPAPDSSMSKVQVEWPPPFRERQSLPTFKFPSSFETKGHCPPQLPKEDPSPPNPSFLDRNCPSLWTPHP